MDAHRDPCRGWLAVDERTVDFIDRRNPSVAGFVSQPKLLAANLPTRCVHVIDLSSVRVRAPAGLPAVAAAVKRLLGKTALSSKLLCNLHQPRGSGVAVDCVNHCIGAPGSEIGCFPPFS